MSVHFSQAASEWYYTCLFGCSGWGFVNQEAATAAFLEHVC